MRASSRRASSSIPSSASSAAKPGRHAPREPFAAGEDSHDGSELGEAALLAADPEHLDAVDAGGGAAGEETAPLVRALRGGLGLGQAVRAQRASVEA